MSHPSDIPDDSLPARGILAELSEPERSELHGFGERIRHAKGDKIVEQGQPQAFLHLLLEGELRVVAASDSALLTLGYVHPGECVGEMTVLEPVEEAAAHVISSTSTLLWCLQRKDFQRFVDQNPAAGARVYCGIAILLTKRLRRRTEHLVEGAR